MRKIQGTLLAVSDLVAAERDDRNQRLEGELLRQVRGVAVESDDCQRMLIDKGVDELRRGGAPVLIAVDGT